MRRVGAASLPSLTRSRERWVLAGGSPSPYPLPLDGFAVGEGGEVNKKNLTPFPCGRG